MPRPPAPRILLITAALSLPIALPAAAPCPARAGEVRAALLRQDAFSAWAAGPNRERDWALHLELGLDPLATVLGGEIAPMLGLSWAPGAEVDTAHAGLTWTLSGEAAFLRLGIGGVVHDGKLDEPPGTPLRRRQFGSRVLFHVPAELGLHLSPRTSIGLYYVHMSNADLADPNVGMDSLGIRLGLRF